MLRDCFGTYWLVVGALSGLNKFDIRAGNSALMQE